MTTSSTDYQLDGSNKSRGVAILFAVLTLSVVLTIGLSLLNITLKQIILASVGRDSQFAFFAADTGIEKILLLRNTPKSFSECTSSASPCVLSNGARFWVVVTCGETNPSVDCAAPGSEIKPNGSTCVSPSYCVESTGEFRGTRRAIEVNY